MSKSKSTSNESRHFEMFMAAATLVLTSEQLFTTGQRAFYSVKEKLARRASMRNKNEAADGATAAPPSNARSDHATEKTDFAKLLNDGSPLRATIYTKDGLALDVSISLNNASQSRAPMGSK